MSDDITPRAAFATWWRSRPVCSAVKSPRGFAQMVWIAALKAGDSRAAAVRRQALEAAIKECEADAFVDQWKGLAEAVKRIRALIDKEPSHG